MYLMHLNLLLDSKYVRVATFILQSDHLPIMSSYIFLVFATYAFIIKLVTTLLQTDNVRNQREHLVLLLANAQSQMGDGSFISGTDLVCLKIFTAQELLNSWQSLVYKI